MVYVDKLRCCVPTKRWRYGSSCHLFADTEAELHVFARELGLKREWFQYHNWLSHYDLTAGMRALAVERGALDGENEVRRRCESFRRGHVYGKARRSEGGVDPLRYLFEDFGCRAHRWAGAL